MKTEWYKLDFIHSCGKSCTPVAVYVNREGGHLMEGICPHCGKEFSAEDSLPTLIAKSAISDYLDSNKETPKDILESFTPPTGSKPS